MSIRPEISDAFALPTADRRPMYDWAHDNIQELPEVYAIRGQFNVRNSPWLIAPFDSMLDPLCRRTTVSKAVQSAGTLLAEIATAHRIANDPGPTSFTAQSDDMAAMEAKTRLWPLLERIPVVARLLPRPGPMKTQQEIYFGGHFLILNSANLSDQQSQSIRYKINDEIWMARWADVYADACARVTAFEQQGTSHILDISQGGFDGGDRPCWATWSFRNGSMEEWSVLCRNPECKKSSPLAIHAKRKDGTRAGMVWAEDAKREDGTFNERRAAETVRWECPHCGHAHDDTDATRAHWRRTGHYVVTNNEAPRSWRSFHWEALVAHPMQALATEFCQAENMFARTGDESARIKFRQKREAKPWKQERNTIEIFSEERSGYTTATFRDAGTPVPGEVGRHMTMDRQKDHWWVEVGAWGTQPTLTYRQLYFGRVDTLAMARQIQQTYGVPDWGVAEDRAYMPSEVDKDCARFGWSGIEGSKTKRKRWSQRDEASGSIVNFPTSDVLLSPVNGGAVPYCQFDGEYFKDLLANALARKGGVTWLLPDDVNPLWREHVAGEEKREVRPGVWEWHEVKTNAANHGLDTSVMQLVIASVRSIISTKESE
jgi:hypothetical protein